MTSFPITRFALARLLVNLAVVVLPSDDYPEAEWPLTRLFWVDDSLKMTLNKLRGKPPKAPGAPR